MKKRPIWLGCLLFAMICSVVLFHRTDSMQFQGLPVKSGEQLRQMTENLSDVSGFQSVDDLIELDGGRIPYDRFQNTFYVSQSVGDDEYAGTFRITEESCDVYIQEDEALQDKRTAIREGHIFRLWFVTQEGYRSAGLIFTGLPMISIRSDDDGLTEEYGRGEIVVQNPDDEDVIAMSVKDSAIQVKTNYHSGTISFKLSKKDYQEERNLNLLGLGKRTSWKLYQVHDRDGSACTEMLSSYVWNCVCVNEQLHRDMAYAEVVLDGAYSGLYYLAPKLGKAYLKLNEDDRLYKAEGGEEAERNLSVEEEDAGSRRETSSEKYSVVGDEDIESSREALEQYTALWNGRHQEFGQINTENWRDYHIWLQTVCAVQGSKEDYCIIAGENNGNYEFFRMPERSKFVFGIYPAERGWESMTAVETVTEDETYEKLAKTLGSAFEEVLADRWSRLRTGALNTETMQQYVRACERELIESGYIARNGNREEYEAACFAVRKFIGQRLEFLDNYIQ